MSLSPGFLRSSFLQGRLRSVTLTPRVITPRPINVSARRTFAQAAAETSARKEQPQWQRHFRSVCYAIIFGSIGYNGSAYVVDRIAGLLPTPGTVEDEEVLKKLRTQLEKLDIVKKLRADPEFVEWEAYDNFLPEEKAQTLTSGQLAGSRALAIQRIFWNEKEKKAVSVIYFGRGLDGWPSVLHGGALSIVLDESTGRVALRSFPDRTGVTANLNINYRIPITSGQFCTVTAQIDHENSTDRKAIVKGEVRDCMGRLCTQASGLFVVPKALTLKRIGEGF